MVVAFIAAYWWLWLILTSVWLAYMLSKIFSVFSGFKKAVKGFKDDEFGGVAEGVEEGVDASLSLFSTKTWVINLVGGAASFLFLLSVVVHLIDYIKQ